MPSFMRGRLRETAQSGQAKGGSPPQPYLPSEQQALFAVVQVPPAEQHLAE
jgi:hypothetical protein